MSRFRVLLPLALAALCLSLPACGAGRGSVSGKITVMGKPYKSGKLAVSFVGKDNQPVTVEVAADGSYQATAVPVGEVRVSVTNITGEGLSPETDAQIKALADKPQLTDEEKKTLATLRARAEAARVGSPVKDPVPERYTDPARSDLKTTVKAGSNEFNADLKVP